MHVSTSAVFNINVTDFYRGSTVLVDSVSVTLAELILLQLNRPYTWSNRPEYIPGQIIPGVKVA